MLIPLDYYRMLGLPIQATPQQLQQAYQERVNQLPRHEYSQSAIAARRQLLDEAYATLSDPEQRQAYDTSFFANSAHPYGTAALPGSPPRSADPRGSAEGADTPTVDASDRQFVGALMLLQELGEYELVLNLGYPHLSNPRDIESGRFGEPQLVLADTLLTVVLAYLELGREQWQQGHMEQAATSLKIGQELLLHHGLFASLRGEIRSDLYKLRPYRVVELLAAPDPNSVAHRQGLQLLRSMLQEREGIDGSGDDRSGLGVEDFLRFIQQIRAHLTAEEQLALFEAEARRPSAVATYLAAYAAIARGFSQRDPALVQRASLLLRRLGNRQDVYLEQAICALLLGQPESACQTLQLSQESDAIEAIESQSQGAPDLLPGLCLYCEHWLQTEVYPHFRDLADREASLKDYFADPQVQAALERLPDEADTARQWTVGSPAASAPTGDLRASAAPLERVGSVVPTNGNGRLPSGATASLDRPPSDAAPPTPDPTGPNPLPAAPTASPFSQVAARSPGSAPASTPPMMPAISGILGERPLSATDASAGPLRDRTYARSGSGAVALADGKNGNGAAALAERPNGRASGGTTAVEPAIRSGDRGGRGDGSGPRSRLSSGDAARSRRPDGRPRSPSAASDPSPRLDRLLVLVAILLLGVGLAGFAVVRAYAWMSGLARNWSGPALDGEQLAVRIDRAPVDIPQPGAALAPADTGPLTEAAAREAIQGWLTAKAAAMGRDRDVEGLANATRDPLLSETQERAEDVRQNGLYWEYDHGAIAVLETTPNPEDDNRGTALAEVREAAQLYDSNGQLNRSASYDSNLRVRYDLAREDGQWRVRDVALQQ